MQTEKESVGSVFCAACLGDSTDETVGNISTINGIGRQFYGSTDPCQTCGSIVRTLWWTFGNIPIIPLGSYRFLSNSPENWSLSSRFLARRTQTRWNQILKIWIVGLLVGALAIYLFSKLKL